jgi:hypothetical protein
MRKQSILHCESWEGGGVKTNIKEIHGVMETIRKSITLYMLFHVNIRMPVQFIFVLNSSSKYNYLVKPQPFIVSSFQTPRSPLSSAPYPYQYLF